MRPHIYTDAILETDINVPPLIPDGDKNFGVL